MNLCGASSAIVTADVDRRFSYLPIQGKASSESLRAANRVQFYVSASRFKETLTIYTDDKTELLMAVRKSSHRPAAIDLVTKEILKLVSEVKINKSPPAAVAENKQKETIER